LIKKIPSKGFLVANMDDKNVKQVAKDCSGKVIPVQTKDWEALNLRLQVMGDFNQLNALHAYKTAERLGADTNKIKQSLEEFNGTWRRMELKGKFNKALLIDDYGHHPTEIQLTLKAIKQRYPKKRLICVFQPHQYSRTHLMLGDFKKAFQYADKVIVTDIYAARDSEMDRAKINSEKLADLIRKNHMDVTWGKDLTNTFHLLKDGVGKNDVLVTMGAGDIGNLADRLAE
jgi:UDP-N-acetylmuramate--alanine ligase